VSRLRHDERQALRRAISERTAASVDYDHIEAIEASLSNHGGCASFIRLAGERIECSLRGHHNALHHNKRTGLRWSRRLDEERTAERTCPGEESVEAA
jgi:hypothetical protein